MARVVGGRRGAGNPGAVRLVAYRFTCTTVAGGKPLKCVELAAE
jgi:hypothetical protein